MRKENYYGIRFKKQGRKTLSSDLFFPAQRFRQQPFFIVPSGFFDYLIQQATAIANKDPKKLTKSERLDFLSFLDEKGAMQISKSGDRICKVLGISKFTLYNDLEIIRSKLEANAQ